MSGARRRRGSTWLAVLGMLAGCRAPSAAPEVRGEAQPPARAVLESPRRYEKGADGADMVALDLAALWRAHPRERGGPAAALGPVLVDRCEVTVGRFRAFCLDTGRPIPPALVGRPDDFPAEVRWSEAAAYARHFGKRLLGWAEVRVLLGCREGAGHFPWGDAAPPAGFPANLKGLWKPEPESNRIGRRPGVPDPRPGLAVVGVSGEDESGLCDLIGNAAEWTSERGFQDDDDSGSAFRGSGPARPHYVVCGGSWDGEISDCMVERRVSRAEDRPAGFRCAVDVPAAGAKSPPGPVEVAFAFLGTFPPAGTPVPVRIRSGGTSWTEWIYREPVPSILRLPRQECDVVVGVPEDGDGTPPLMVPVPMEWSPAEERAGPRPVLMEEGGVALLPRAWRVLPRLAVRCTGPSGVLERWTAAATGSSRDDLVWPALPPGTWKLEVRIDDAWMDLGTVEIRAGEMSLAR